MDRHSQGLNPDRVVVFVIIARRHLLVCVVLASLQCSLCRRTGVPGSAPGLV